MAGEMMHIETVRNGIQELERFIAEKIKEMEIHHQCTIQGIDLDHEDGEPKISIYATLELGSLDPETYWRKKICTEG